MRIQKNLIRKLKANMLIFAVTAIAMPFFAQAQSARITLPPKKLSAMELFEEINHQTSYKVMANMSRLGNNLSVKVNRSPVAVSEVLDRLLKGTGFTYSIDGNLIIMPVAISKTAPDQPKKVVTPAQTVSKPVKSNPNDLPVENIPAEVPASTQLPATTQPPVKTTAYFVPNAKDNAIKAFTDEPKTSMSLIPETEIGTTNYQPKAAIKTNLLYWATTSINLGAEFGLARKWTFDVSAGLNTWDLNGRKGGIRHWLVQPELRYWFCQRFEKHFIGLHGIGGQYQISDINLKPFGNDLSGKRYDGYGIGGGISYGYHLPIAKRWSLEFTAGAGYIYLDYDKYNCGECDNLVGSRQKHYFGPTKAGVSLIFMIK